MGGGVVLEMRWTASIFNDGWREEEKSVGTTAERREARRPPWVDQRMPRDQDTAVHWFGIASD
jgi:hypothetical protein